MLSNRAARRLLGLSYTVSNSKRGVKVSLLNLASGDSSHQLPEHLSHSSFVAMKRHSVSGKVSYHSGKAFYPEYLNAHR
ncbi:stationary-phase-induced ribosome-associated protein [Xenorhabdus szentirmaii]|uniref:Stationary-phase-induced ribosome-associated protein n=2 Tax=Xenorhabdus szentirmaii TaxID=290112 RepID=W1IZY9_9GAMM|nr:MULTISPECIES: stationary-phase-induced ribosome-associated protein [Xenorhabdus]MBD2779440.1 stationary-phase-induced ribosome-associated protein [Xenorhabdus sp. 38]MBD2791034.1 stationary-phase-induced ribosome-associated protein [Xenorhabdus sp. CUL]MBD2799199.1 stationary-phase-induced ribosome-associated protein [Xenorhabdus sp. M]MBD2804070.1 stationary-phase-induced ribosome-associated protein [Xenorhabdus sp. ZM]MBD2820142.1 stationary-phase-induced ribosome-associated protein [Xeno